MIITIEIPKEIEAQLRADAQASGMQLSDYVREFTLDRYEEDLEDIRVAEARLNDPQPIISSDQLRKNLGLDR
jgi:predicted DNA-binding protein